MTFDLTPVLGAVITLAITIMTAIVIPYIKKKIGDEKYAEIERWVGVAVQAAEQLFAGSGRGAEKLAFVEEFLASTRATYNGNMNGVVVHFYVWHNDIWQNLDESERGWHAADGSSSRKDHRGNQTGGNLDTIAIETIGADTETETTVEKLVAYLCKKYGLDPKYDVYTHNYWMYGKDAYVSGARKNCPTYILPHWDKFLVHVNNYYSSETETKKTLYKVQCGAFAVKSNASALKTRLVNEGFKDAYIVSINGLYKVQVGAFAVKDNAVKLQEKLKDKGYNTFIVQQ